MTLLDEARRYDLSATLHDVRRIILEGGNGAIVDTIWYDDTTTLVELITIVLDESGSPKGTDAGGG